MEEMLFRIMVIVLSLILLVVVAIILVEVITHRKDGNRFRPKLKYMRPYKDGYAFSDNPELVKSMQVMYITSEFIEFSDTGLDGKYHRIWEF